MAETTTIANSTTVLQVPTTLKSLIEGLIFAAHEPLTVKQIQTLYEYDGVESAPRKLAADEIESVVKELNDEYLAADRPYRIIHLAGGFQFATLKEYAEWLGKLYKEQSRRKLSQSAVESLAIIAYKQPISKSEIESIRGVNCDYVLKTLLEKELVTIVGRAPTPGRPLLYGTTRDFLKHFGLNEITDLPRPREIEEILGETQFETERRMLEAQQGIQDQTKEEEDFKSRLPHIPKRKSELEKEVKIIPRRKTRQLKVQHTEESPEEQKQLTLIPEHPVQLVPESQQVEQEQVAEDTPEVKQDSESGESRQQPIGTDSQTAVRDMAVIEPAPESTVSEDVQTNVQPDAPYQQGTPYPKSKWQTWKEKIQGFIKKLFD